MHEDHLIGEISFVCSEMRSRAERSSWPSGQKRRLFIGEIFHQDTVTSERRQRSETTSGSILLTHVSAPSKWLCDESAGEE